MHMLLCNFCYAIPANAIHSQNMLAHSGSRLVFSQLQIRQRTFASAHTLTHKHRQAKPLVIYAYVCGCVHQLKMYGFAFEFLYAIHS